MSHSTPRPPAGQTLSMIIIGVLFALFGIITWLNGTLTQFLKVACQLNEQEATLVTFAFFISYTVMALPSARVLQATGFKRGMSLGLIVMALGCLLFVPAAQNRSYPLFLAGLFTQGLGLTLLQAASNPFVTVVGPIETAARRISIMGICNKVAGALGAIALGALLLTDLNALDKKLKTLGESADKSELLQQLSNKVIWPYVGLAALLIIVAVLVALSPLPEVKDDSDKAVIEIVPGGRKSALQYPYLVLGVIAIFAYVGVEVLAGDYIIRLGNYLKVEDEYLKYLTSITLFFMLAGYVVGIVLIPKYLSQARALAFNAVGGLLLAGALLFVQGKAAVFCLAFLGFFHAVMWPAIWPLSITGLGRHTKTGSALLIMGIAGGAVVPYLWGTVGQHNGGNLQGAFWIMIPCYLFILYFAVAGHKMGLQKSEKVS